MCAELCVPPHLPFCALSYTHTHTLLQPFFIPLAHLLLLSFVKHIISRSHTSWPLLFLSLLAGLAGILGEGGGGGLPEKWGPYGDCMVECLGLGRPPLPPHAPEQPTLLLALRSALSDGVQALRGWGASRAALPISFYTAVAYNGTADLLRTESKWHKISVGKSSHIVHFIFRY